MVNILDDSPDVEVDDGLAVGGGFEEGEVIGIVLEKVLREGNLGVLLEKACSEWTGCCHVMK